MDNYLYNTDSDWQIDLRKNWKSSGKKYFTFPWLNFTPTKFTEETKKPFWLYFFYTGEIEVRYRVKVIDFNLTGYKSDKDTYRSNSNGDCRIWFKCDQFDELDPSTNKYDFEHVDSSKKLLSATRRSIPQFNFNLNP